MKSIISLLSALVLTSSVIAQDSLSTRSLSKGESPYKTSWKVDAPVTAGFIGLNVLGLSLIKNKKGLSTADALIAQNDKKSVNGIDRFSAGWYSESIDKISYYPFYGSFAMPVVLLLNKNMGSKAGQVLAMYIETMAVTGSLYTITAGSINRSRPYVYGTEAPLDKRMDKGARRSFFAGHTAATASASFFAAKVFNDFNPDSKAKPYVWATAAALPAFVGYCRLKGGNHFLTDNLLGYAVGASAGILVPHLHKKDRSNNLSIVPVSAPDFNGMNVTYTFK
jgi:membrane-associated phospholipid phosphatase